MKDPAPAFPALLHYEVAHRILKGYMDYYYRFKLITKRARLRFEARDWHGTQADARSRIVLYRDEVRRTTRRLQDLTQHQPGDKPFWARVRDAFTEEIAHFDTRNIAETFFNSVYRHAYGIGADREVMFVERTGSYREYHGLSTISHDFQLGDDPLAGVVERVLECFPFDVNWDDRAARRRARGRPLGGPPQRSRGACTRTTGWKFCARCFTGTKRPTSWDGS